MKVLLFIHSLGGGGAERVTAALANHWATLGWQIDVVTLASTEADRFQVQPAVHRTAMNLAGESSSMIRRVTENIKRIWALRRIIADTKPHVALSMTSRCNVMLALTSLGFKNMVSIGSERIHPPEYPIGAAWAWLRARVYGLLDAVVVFTGEAQRWVYDHTSAQLVRVIPNPVTWPLVPHRPIRSPNEVGAPGRKRLLAVGRLAPQKGFAALIAVFARLASRFSDWELVIVGEGSERAHLQQMIDRLELGSVVFLPGHVGNIGDWYGRADLFVLTSRFEGFPNVLAEAMTYGLPVISVDCATGPREIVRPQVDGLLIDVDDDSALEGALERLMRNTREREQFARRAIEARDRFAIKRVHAMWMSLFQELTAARPGTVRMSEP